MKIILTLLSVTGVILNAKKKRICFIIWLITNTSWAIVDFSHGLWEQGALFVVYVALAIYGWFNWKKKSIWHRPEERPKEFPVLILYQTGHIEKDSGKNYTGNGYSKEIVQAWAYIKDLPK